jgi:hypothetical protein
VSIISNIQQAAATQGKYTRALEKWRLGYEETDGRKPDSYWHPSSISGCPTAAVYEYLGFPLGKPKHDARLLRIFDTGTALHRMLQFQFVSAGAVARLPQWEPALVADAPTRPAVEVPFVNEDLRLKGTGDIIFEINGIRALGEIKSKHSGSFAKLKAADPAHKVQATCYTMEFMRLGYLTEPNYVVFYFSKDDSHIAEFPYRATDEDFKGITDKITLMNGLVAEFQNHQRVPEPHYKEPHKSPCRTCQWAACCHAAISRDAWITKIKEQANAQTQDPKSGNAASAAPAKPGGRRMPVRR